MVHVFKSVLFKTNDKIKFRYYSLAYEFLIKMVFTEMKWKTLNINFKKDKSSVAKLVSVLKR